jgi:hypothetical protein
MATHLSIADITNGKIPVNTLLVLGALAALVRLL